MNDFLLSTPFELTGEFGGMVFTEAGKRRLLLRVDGTERLLKVLKPLRRRMAGNFRPGQTIRVGGTEERDQLTGTSKWVVTAVLPPGGEAMPAVPVATPSGPLRVCAKKNCWRDGGRELFAALEQGIEARGLTGQVQVKAVNCLDRCKQAPNIDWGDREFSRCHLRDAEAILDRAAAACAPVGATNVGG